MLTCAIKEIHELGYVGTQEAEEHHHHHYEGGHDHERHGERGDQRGKDRSHQETRVRPNRRQAWDDEANDRDGRRPTGGVDRDGYEVKNEPTAKEVLHMLGGLHQQYRSMGDVSVQLRQRHRIDID